MGEGRGDGIGSGGAGGGDGIGSGGAGTGDGIGSGDGSGSGGEGRADGIGSGGEGSGDGSGSVVDGANEGSGGDALTLGADVVAPNVSHAARQLATITIRRTPSTNLVFLSKEQRRLCGQYWFANLKKAGPPRR